MIVVVYGLGALLIGDQGPEICCAVSNVPRLLQLMTSLPLTGGALVNMAAACNFAAEASKYTVGLQFDGPLNRLAERNEGCQAQADWRQEQKGHKRGQPASLAAIDKLSPRLRPDT